MEQPVISQLICALVSLGGGLLFGVAYDFFKAFRLKLKSLLFSAAADVVVCAAGLALLFFLFMSIGGGQARIYIVVCASAGAVLYFLTASAVILEFFTGILELIAKFLHFLAKPIKFFAKKMEILYKKVKMFFQNACKRFTMAVQGEVSEKIKTSRKPQRSKKEQSHEAKARRNNNKNRHSGVGAIRGGNPVFGKKADRRSSGKTR